MNIIVLDSTKSIQAQVTSGSSATGLDCIVHYADEISGSPLAPASQTTSIVNGTLTTVCSAPGASTTRMIREITLDNLSSGTMHFKLTLLTSGSTTHIIEDDITTLKTWVMSDKAANALTAITGAGVMSGTTGAVVTHNNSTATAAAYTNANITIDQYGHVTVAANGTGGGGGGGDGWTADTNTWTYSSADSPTFVISVNADMTAIIGVGYRIKLTQTTVKYFIVTAVGTYTGGGTLITVYGGTDYTLANAAITNSKYSNVKAPFGFPLSPSKWTVIITNAGSTSQSSPTIGTWYNPGAIYIDIPIGTWDMGHDEVIRMVNTGLLVQQHTTLSTANNSESNTEFSIVTAIIVNGNGSNTLQVDMPNRRRSIYTAASKTRFYLNCETDWSQTIIGFYGGTSPTTITAICIYL